MMRSMFAGVSGLRAHQTMTDVVAGNIANVNTVGYKASRVQFADSLSQQLRNGAGNGIDMAGMNPLEVGLGVTLASTNRSFAQGGLQLTGRATDAAISGEGFFIIGNGADGAERSYTRAGSFSFDDAGFLTDPGGGFVMGWNADVTGTVVSSRDPEPLRIPTGLSIDPVATANIEVLGNLDADATVGDTWSTAIDVIDGQGKRHRMTLEFELTAPNTWDITTTDPGGVVLGTDTITFDAGTGALSAGTVNPTYTYTPPGGVAFTFAADLGTPGSATALTQYAGASSAVARSQDGQEQGNLRSFAITDDGMLSGVFSNGHTQVLGALALTSFINPPGLLSIGENRYRATDASGEPFPVTATSGDVGSISSGTLEMSNVELSEEFTNLIIAQRGFQANSRVITTSDEMIQELVNLKR